MRWQLEIPPARGHLYEPTTRTMVGRDSERNGKEAMAASIAVNCKTLVQWVSSAWLSRVFPGRTYEAGLACRGYLRIQASSKKMSCSLGGQ